MIHRDCEAAHDDIDAWALGALDADEARALEAHLATCDDCRALADAASETAASLGLAVPMHGASATLKSRVVASAAVLTDIGRPRGRRRMLWPAAVAALLVGAVGLGAWAAVTQSRVDDLEGRNARLSAGATEQARAFIDASATEARLTQTIATQDAVLEIVMQPDLQRTELVGTEKAPGASGRCVWSRSREVGAMLVDGLPHTPDNAVYTMWIVYERKWLEAGDFTVDDGGEGRLVMDAWGSDTDDWGAFEGFAVTVEPASGTSAERGDTIMRSVLAD